MPICNQDILSLAGQNIHHRNIAENTAICIADLNFDIKKRQGQSLGY
jgi:hypothetical protein